MSANEHSKKPLQVMGFGNPLLDLVTEAPTSLIEKYNLELNNMYLAEPYQIPIYEEIQNNHHFKYVPGGATLNSMRFLQALTNKNQCVMFTGCVGNDKEGEKMANLLREEGMASYFQVNETTPTGICAVLVNNNDRALCTNLGASGKFSFDYYQENIRKLLPQVDVCFSAAYFMSSCFEAMFDMSKYCAENNKIYSFGLAAPFMIDIFSKQMMELMEFTDILFGNKSEIETLKKATNFDSESTEEFMTYLVNLPKANSKRNRMIIATQSENPVLVATKDDSTGEVMISHYHVNKVPKEKIVDVNGSGDAFVGGFLYGISNHKSLDECVYYAIEAATHVLQKVGSAFSVEELSQIPTFPGSKH